MFFNQPRYKIVESSVYFSFDEDSKSVSYLEKELKRLKELLSLRYSDVLYEIRNLGIPEEYVEKLKFNVEDTYEYMSLHLSLMDEYEDSLIYHFKCSTLSSCNTSLEESIKQARYEFNKKYIRIRRDVLQKIIEEIMFLHYNFPINIYTINTIVIVKEIPYKLNLD